MNSAPSKFYFYLRLFLIIILITNVQAAGILAMFYYIMNATAGDLIEMLWTVALPVAVINLLYIIIAFSLAAGLHRFLAESFAGDELPPKNILRARDRAMNLPYYLGLLSFIFFIAGSTIITWLSLRELQWPSELLVFGALGGVLCGMLAIPLYIHFGSLLIQPVIDRTIVLLPHHQSAARAGQFIPLRLKVALILISVVASSVGYTAIMGYSQTSAVLANMQRMEKLLPTDTATMNLLVTDPDTASDPRIRRASFFAQKLGGLRDFYITLMAVSTFVAILLAGLAARQIVRPITELLNVAQRVKAGHYGDPVRLVSNDELAELGQAINSMMTTITGYLRSSENIIGGVDSGVRKIGSSIETMLAVSDQLAGGATEQLVSVQQATAIAEEIVATSREIAGRAKMVEQVAGNTQNAGRAGEEKLGEAWTRFKGIVDLVEAIQKSIGELEHKFMEIYKAVEWMEDMAEQTDLLALNASLEAAGAGAEGRRFAVVAQSTRRLAQRSADSARDIREMIEAVQQATLDSIKIAEGGRDRVTLGRQALEEAVTTLKSISTLAGDTTQAVSEISLSTAEQSDASEQLAQAFANIQEVATKVEQSARQTRETVRELQEFTRLLKETLGGD